MLTPTLQDNPTPIEKAFLEYAEPYTGMQGVDMEKSSHGRAFRAGWLAAMKRAAQLLNQLHDSESLKSEPSGFRKRG